MAAIDFRRSHWDLGQKPRGKFLINSNNLNLVSLILVTFCRKNLNYILAESVYFTDVPDLSYSDTGKRSVATRYASPVYRKAKTEMCARFHARGVVENPSLADFLNFICKATLTGHQFVFLYRVILINYILILCIFNKHLFSGSKRGCELQYWLIVHVKIILN